MKKKSVLLFVCFALVLGMIFSNVFAEDVTVLSERGDKSKKTILNIQGINLYTSISLSLNFKDGKVFNSENNYVFPGREAVVGNLGVQYDESTGIIDVKIKRSDINNVIKDTDTNVYGVMNVNFDLHEFDNIKYVARKWGKTVAESDISFPKNYGTYIDENYFEFFGSGIELTGTPKPNVSTAMSTFYLFNDDQLQSLPDSRDIDSSNLDVSSAIFSYQPKVRVTIEEDVKMDLKKIESSLSFSSNTNENNEIVNQTTTATDIKKVYEEYDTNSNLKYKWEIVQAGEGDVSFSTKIVLDDSPNKDTILSNIEDENSKVMYITFEHHGELGTEAAVTLYVGNTFKSGDKIYLYYFNEETKKLEYIEQDIIVDEAGYARISITHCSDYILMDNLKVNPIVANDVNNNIIDNKKIDIRILITIIITVVIIVTLVILFVIVRKKQNKNKIKEENNI